MISFGQLMADTQILLNAETTTRFSWQDYFDAANDALDELSEGSKFYERSVTIPMVGGATYYDLRGWLPESMIRVNAVFNPNIQIWLDPLGPRDLKARRWELVIGEPRKYLLRGVHHLGVYPKVNSDNTSRLQVSYSGLAPHFKDDYSICPDLPDDFIPALQEYIMYDILGGDGDTQKAMGHWNRYKAWEKKLEAYVGDRVVASRAGQIGGVTYAPR